MSKFVFNPLSRKWEIADNASTTSGGSTNPISITAANFLTAYNNQFVPASPVLVEGYYLITDQCEVGMLVQTVKDRRGIITPSLEAFGIYDNPDFQDVGNYSNLPIAKGTNFGVWYQGLELTTITYDTLVGGNFMSGDTITEPTNGAVGICISDDGSTLTLVKQTPTHFFVGGNSINNGTGVSANELVVTPPTNAVALGDIVFWDGFHFQLQDDTAINGTNPNTNTTAYFRLVKGSNANVGYIRVECKVEYDFKNNWIQAYADERGIIIRDTFLNGNLSIGFFQKGNDNVYGNDIPDGCIWDCINQRGSITNNKNLINANITTGNKHTGIIDSSSFRNTVSTIEKNTGKLLRNCVIDNVSLTIDPTTIDSFRNFTDYPSYDNATDAAAALPSNALWQTSGGDLTFLGGVANIVLRVP